VPLRRESLPRRHEKAAEKVSWLGVVRRFR